MRQCGVLWCAAAAWVGLLGAASAALGGVFTVLEKGPVENAPAWSVAGPRPRAGVVASVDGAALREALAGAPVHVPGARLADGAVEIELPGPDGEMVRCRVAESAVMAPELGAKYSGMRTYVVETWDRSASGRLEVTPRGVTAMLRGRLGNESGGGAGAWMIDPWRSGDSGHVVSYWLRDLPGSMDWECGTAAGEGHEPAHDDGRANETTGFGPGPVRVRTLRLAVACTGEFGVFHSLREGHEPNVADPLAVIVTMVARANVVYEADLAIHFELVANNDQLVFIDPATDPYPNTCDGGGGSDCSGALLSVNPSVLNTRIGSANYDIGHVMTRVTGGVAYLRSVCGGNKGGGVSGIPRGGDVDPLSALILIHEMGHQFGANHTFSGTLGRCAGNLNPNTAWEAGSGSSPMGYAGACPVGDALPTDNIVRFADPFFHHGSLEEARGFLATVTCGSFADSSNRAPVVTPTRLAAFVPAGTPFELTASVEDPDGDPVTVSWEQRDWGVARPLTGPGATDNGRGALFRIFPPVLSPSRLFPRLEDVRSGVPTPGERLPTAAGTRRFKALARDNAPGAGGATISSEVSLEVVPTGGVFAVTGIGAGEIVPAGSMLLTWNAAGTDSAPFLCGAVRVRLSRDDGLTFPIELGEFPNSGAASVVLPPTAAARMRIDGVGQVFFAMSPPFSVEAACAADVDDGSATGTRDFAVTIDDLLFYLGRFEAGDVLADLDDGSMTGTPDEAVTIEDLLFFLARFEIGC